jgi:hypothetical protein
MKSERGDWHRRTRRGTAPPSVAGAGVVVCGFCAKVFKTAQGVQQHERTVHAELIRKRLQEIPATTEFNRAIYCGNCTTPNTCKFGRCIKENK